MEWIEKRVRVFMSLSDALHRGETTKNGQKKGGVDIHKLRLFLITLLLFMIGVFFAFLKSEAGKNQTNPHITNTSANTVVGTPARSFADIMQEQQSQKEKISVSFEKPPVTTIKITVAGDCMLASDFGQVKDGNFASKALEHDWNWFFQDASRYFSEDDFTIVNLENVFTDDESLKPRDKGEGRAYWYKAPTENTNILTASSVEVVNLANNHTRDYGEKGAEDTLTACENAGLLCGTNEKTVYLQKDGFVIALICHGLWYEEQSEEIIKRLDVAKSKSDFQIVYYHGGTERVHKPEEWRIRASRKLVDEGADLVIGNHPHVLQPIEKYKGVEILYSMGNFCFGGDRHPENRSILYCFEVTANQDKTFTTESVVIPYYCYTGNTNNWQPKQIEDKEEIECVLSFLRGESKSPISKTEASQTDLPLFFYLF